MKLIFEIIRFQLEKRRAINAAIKGHEADGRKYLVIVLKGKPTCVTKGLIRKWLSQGAFKKGVTMRDIEKKALFISK